MTNQEMRDLKERLGLIDFKINYKTGVHYGVIEDFFSGKTDELDPDKTTGGTIWNGICP